MRPRAGRRPTFDLGSRAMHEGTWTLRPCPRREVEALASALGISEVTASVLVRRGYGDPAEAQAFLRRRRLPTIRSCSATCALPATPCSRLSPQGAASACTATTTSTASARRRSPSRRCASSGPTSGWHLPSRFAEGYGLSREALEAIAARGVRPGSDRRLRNHGGRCGGRGEGARARRRDHRPPPCGWRAPRLPHRRDAALRLSLPGALRDGRGLQARPGARRRGRADARPRRAGDRRRRRPARRREPGPRRRAGCRGSPRTERPGLAALMRTAGVDAATVDAGAVGFRLAPRINAAGRLGHPGAALELLLTDDRAGGSAGSPASWRR